MSIKRLVVIMIFSFWVMLGAGSVAAQGKKINWMTWDQAIAAQKKNPKKLVLDMYTDWCGWCKKMDSTSFVNARIVDYINTNYYAVKFDAEGRDTILYEGVKFHWIQADKNNSRKGVHTLAYALLDGNLAYPSLVYLNEKMERIIISPGFKEAEGLMKELKFVTEEMYKTKSFDAYINGR